MAITSVTETPEVSTDDLLCKCEQVAGVLNVIAQSDDLDEEIRSAIWGAHSLASEAKRMAVLLVYPEREGA